MVRITLDLPNEIAEELASKWHDLPRAALEGLALEAYRSGALPHAQVRRLLGFATRWELDAFLKEHEVFLEYTVDDLDADAETHQRLGR